MKRLLNKRFRWDETEVEPSKIRAEVKNEEAASIKWEKSIFRNSVRVFPSNAREGTSKLKRAENIPKSAKANAYTESNEIRLGIFCISALEHYVEKRATKEREKERKSRGNKKNATSRRNMSLITTHASCLTKKRESVATALPLEIHWKSYLAGPTLINNINARHGIDE